MVNQWYDTDNIQWSDSLYYEWATEELSCVYRNNGLIFMATTGGLYIFSDYDLNNYQVFVPISGGITSMWVDTISLFIGTNYGIYEIKKSFPQEVNIYVQYPFINSNKIRHIYGDDNVIMSCTNMGVNITKRKSQYTTHSNVIDSNKCFVNGNNYYYTTICSGIHSVNKLINNSSDWTIPDIVYTSGNSFLPANITINDVFVSDNEFLFVATNSGIYIYDELNDDYYVFGESNNYNSVTADKNSSINVGYMYASTVDPVSSFSVVNLWTKEVTDYYSTNSSGRANSPLVKDGVYDFDVNI